MIDHCPKCNTSWRDGKNVIGIEMPKFYDGVLFWWCQSCDAEVPREHLMDQYMTWKALGGCRKDYAE